MNTRNLLSMIVLLVLLGCKKKEFSIPMPCPTPSSFVMPNTVGSYWIYENYQVSDTSNFESLLMYNDTVRVIGDTLINGVSFLIKSTKSNPNSQVKYTYQRDSLDFIIYENGMIWFAPPSFVDTIHFFDFGGGFSSYYYNSNSQGTFSYKGVDYSTSIMNQQINRQNLKCTSDSIWITPYQSFVDGIGMVNFQASYTTDISCQHYEKRLIEYYIAP